MNQLERSLSRRMSLTLLLLLAAALCPASEQTSRSAAAQAPASESPSARNAVPPDLPASQPGPDHRWLDPLVGSWNADLRWSRAGGAEIHLTGTSDNRWILDGRFLLCDLSAGEGPSRVEAMTIYGFDDRQKRHFVVQMHNRATSFTQLWGSYDPAARSFLLSARERSETTGAVVVSREVLKIDGPDRHVLSAYLDLPRRAPVKIVEAVFTRR